jgi:hypothetical protein
MQSSTRSSVRPDRAGRAGSSPEQGCLLLLARGELRGEERDRAGCLLAQPLAWPAIVGWAHEHGVLPAVARNLRRLGWLHVPDAIQKELEAAERLNAIRNRLLARGLETILGRFAEAGIPAIPLKGVALAEVLYGDVGLRVCADVDVLVPRRAVPRAFGLLLSDSWEQTDRLRVEPSEVDFLARSAMEYGFTPPASSFPFLLELHWDIAWRWRGDTAMLDDLWIEARRQVLWGVEAWALSPEWELLYLAVHAARHRWQGLKWLVDIHEVCTRAKVDWDTVTVKAHRFGLDRALGFSLSACQALFGTPLPLAYSGRPFPSWLPLFPASAPQMGEWREALLVRRLFRRPQDRLCYLARIALRPTRGELEFVRLPTGLRALYYPLRLVRLAIASAWAMGELAGSRRNSLGL